jgi:hypothetical protein
MGEITLLLRQWNDGDSTALDPLFELVFPQLRKIAAALFRGERPSWTPAAGKRKTASACAWLVG